MNGQRVRERVLKGVQGREKSPLQKVRMFWHWREEVGPFLHRASVEPKWREFKGSGQKDSTPSPSLFLH